VNKAIRAVLFDLDDTLPENNMDRFVKEYFGLSGGYLLCAFRITVILQLRNRMTLI
jgi:hypothetical protein